MSPYSLLGYLGMVRRLMRLREMDGITEHSENKIIKMPKTKLDLECSGSASKSIALQEFLAIWLLLFKQRKCNFNQSNDDSFVERVAKNNS